MREPIPYSRQSISEADIESVTRVLRAPFLTQGPAVVEFEEAFAERHSQPHAIAVSNATNALHLACLALDVSDGSLVWTSPNSFVASANCARYCGADVDFVDIDPETRNMSIDALASKLEEASARNTLPDVVIPVDFGGYPCDMREIRELADRYGFRVISDSSHAVGAEYRGEPIGKYADISVFSFHPVKIITTGEGGLCLTADGGLADRLRSLRSHGITRKPDEFVNEPDGPWYYEQTELGYNYRITDLQAALGQSQLEALDARMSRREELALRYDEQLASLPLLVPPRSIDRRSAHHLYVIEIDENASDISRGDLFEHLRQDGISPNVHYIPIHLQPDFARLGFSKGDFPNSERYYRRALTIPLYPDLRDDEQDRVVASLSAKLT